jgi:GxxExxY protein
MNPHGARLATQVRMLTSHLPYSELTEQIVEGFHETVGELGKGFGEIVCQRAFQIVLRDRGLLAEMGFKMNVHFRGELIGDFFADLVVERLIVIEVKATSKIEDWHKAQLLNYLRVGGGGVGFVANFGQQASIKRFVVGDPYHSLPLIEKHPGAAKWSPKPPTKR